MSVQGCPVGKDIDILMAFPGNAARSDVFAFCPVRASKIYLSGNPERSTARQKSEYTVSPVAGVGKNGNLAYVSCGRSAEGSDEIMKINPEEYSVSIRPPSTSPLLTLKIFVCRLAFLY